MEQEENQFIHVCKINKIHLNYNKVHLHLNRH